MSLRPRPLARNASAADVAEGADRLSHLLTYDGPIHEGPAPAPAPPKTAPTESLFDLQTTPVLRGHIKGPDGGWFKEITVDYDYTNRKFVPGKFSGIYDSWPLLPRYRYSRRDAATKETTPYTVMGDVVSLKPDWAGQHKSVMDVIAAIEGPLLSWQGQPDHKGSVPIEWLAADTKYGGAIENGGAPVVFDRINWFIPVEASGYSGKLQDVLLKTTMLPVHRSYGVPPPPVPSTPAPARPW